MNLPFHSAMLPDLPAPYLKAEPTTLDGRMFDWARLRTNREIREFVERKVCRREIALDPYPGEFFPDFTRYDPLDLGFGDSYSLDEARQGMQVTDGTVLYCCTLSLGGDSYRSGDLQVEYMGLTPRGGHAMGG